MAVLRETIERIYEEYWSCANAADWETLVEFFSDDCSFTNSAMEVVIEGKNSLRDLARTWPPVVNIPEWHAIDGNRLVVSWQERPKDAVEKASYRGVSSFLFDDEAKISEYVGTFNMQEVISAFTE